MRFLMAAVATLSLWGQTNPNELTSDWLLREDIFAGLLENDRPRLLKAIETMKEIAPYYPAPTYLTWKYSAEVMQAVWAYEDKDMAGFNRHYSLALTYLNQVRKAAKGPGAVLPEIFEGATMAVLADRMPENMRKGAWERAYQAYARLDELQGPAVSKMPMHIQGESLSGLAATAFRTGREAVMLKALERLQTGLPKTPYATIAKKWAEDPAARGKVKIVCISCHEPNRLGRRLEVAHGAENK